jgi:hypothetical protein
MLIDVYAAESVLLRVKKIIESRGEAGNEVYLDILRVFFNDAVSRIAFNGKEALQSFAEGDELRMMLMGLKRFTKTEPFNTKEARQQIALKVIEANKYCF